jgi:hypothetical protein
MIMARRDPALSARKHRDHNRRYWQNRRLPCARCGGPIDYDGPQRLPNGQLNPRYLVVGHVVSRTRALELGWSLAMINDLTNTQPECWLCSIISGGEEGVQARRAARGRRRAPAGKVQLSAPESKYW